MPFRHLGRFRRSPFIWLLCLSCIGLSVGFTAKVATAQTSVQQQEDQVIREFVLPSPTQQAPVVRPRSAPAPAAPRRSQPSTPTTRPQRPEPQNSDRNEPAPAPAETIAEPDTPETPPTNQLPTSQYVLEFNRSPVVGNRFRLQGILAEARLGFTRPQNWQVKSAKALIRYQHSPALLANRSNLTVRLNGTSIGSVPLNRRQSEIGQALFNIPPNLVQDFNEITIVAQQNNSATCTEPGDQTLWTEVLPDSKLLFDFTPQPIALDFSRYPYPFLDRLGLDPDRLAYLRPKDLSQEWLTSSARLQTSLGRFAEFRPVETRLVGDLTQVQDNERLIVIGTPAEQPALSRLSLPFPIANGQILDGSRNVLPGDVGVLMMATTKAGGVPVLVATGNDASGVAKAVQALVQPDRQIMTGQSALISSVNNVPSPDPRAWDRYLPLQNSFKLSDLKTSDNKPFQDITVRGSYPAPVRIDFRALPDDRFSRGNTMTMDYSYSPQINPRTSSVQVNLDGVALGGQQLRSQDGGNGSFTIGLPENAITSTSVLEVYFLLDPRERGTCGKVVDSQLWATVHADTTKFNLKRNSVVELPDLRLLQAGFPLTAPQDLSSTAIVLPDAPKDADVLTLLEFSKRMGQISRADSVKLNAYLAGTLPVEAKNEQNLVGIGTRDRFPIPEVFEKGGFVLRDLFGRQQEQSQIQVLPDSEGVIKSVISPWNDNRVLIALTAQTDNGLDQVQDIFRQDPLFFQMQGDTMLVSRNQTNSSAYDPNAYNLEFLQQSQQREINRSGLLDRVSQFLQANWFLLPTGIVLLALVFYGVSQLYMNRVSKTGGKS